MEAPVASADELTSDDRVSALRGAGVRSVDRRRLLCLGVIVIALGLGVGSIALYVAGARKNAQISELRHHGVPVEITVTGCQGLIGGSGSNGAGYACRGTFTVDGRRFDEGVPGNRLLAPGAKIRAIAVPDGSGLMTTPATLATEHASNDLYVLPSVLAVLALAAVTGLVVVWRRAKPTEAGP
jgi:hypothetical protein